MFCLLVLQILQILSLVIVFPLIFKHFVIQFVGVLVLIEASRGFIPFVFLYFSNQTVLNFLILSVFLG
jgi:hypothetical protein